MESTEILNKRGWKFLTPIITVSILLAASPLSIFPFCPVGHAPQFVGLGVWCVRHAIEHGLRRNGWAPAIAARQSGHEVQEGCGSHDVYEVMRVLVLNILTQILMCMQILAPVPHLPGETADRRTSAIFHEPHLPPQMLSYLFSSPIHFLLAQYRLFS